MQIHSSLPGLEAARVDTEGSSAAELDCGKSSRRRRCKHCRRTLRHSHGHSAGAERKRPSIASISSALSCGGAASRHSSNKEKLTQASLDDHVDPSLRLHANAADLGRLRSPGRQRVATPTPLGSQPLDTCSTQEVTPYSFERASPSVNKASGGKTHVKRTSVPARRTATNILVGWRNPIVLGGLPVANTMRVDPSEHDLRKYEAIYAHGLAMQERRDERVHTIRQSLMDREVAECSFQPQFVPSATLRTRPNSAPCTRPIRRVGRDPTSRCLPNLRMPTDAFTTVLGSDINGVPPPFQS